jgi:hypothetical protein
MKQEVVILWLDPGIHTENLLARKQWIPRSSRGMKAFFASSTFKTRALLLRGEAKEMKKALLCDTLSAFTMIHKHKTRNTDC